MSVDRMMSFLSGMLAAVAVLMVLAHIFDPVEEKVARGWFEHQGKLYRVVPAEVR